MSRKAWKPRLKDMRDAIDRILIYSSDAKNLEDFSADQKTLDACIRNFQILGEASSHIPLDVRKRFPKIPWKQMKGMRNILVHKYFGTSNKILWNTIKKNLPELVEKLKHISEVLDRPVHKSKICPPGECFVSTANISEYITKGFPVREHLRSHHCRECEKTAASVLTVSEIKILTEILGNEAGDEALADLGFGKKGARYDKAIKSWVKFWNEVFNPETPLDPDFFKALIASESSFELKPGKKKRGSARGLLQLMPDTIKYLGGYRDELKDHLFEMDANDAENPDVAIAAGTRWLFRKKEIASSKLERPSTWEEAVEQYKSVRKGKTSKAVYERVMKGFEELIGKIPK